MCGDASTPRAKKSWQARLSAEADPAAAELVASLDVDRALWRYDIAGSIVHAQMLHERGLLTRDEFRTIRDGLREIGAEREAG